MPPRLRTRLPTSRFGHRRVPRRNRPAKRFDVPHQLPALGFRQLRPDRHPLSNHTIRQYPENRAWRRALNLGGTEAWRLRATSRGVTMTFGAVLSEENAASSNGVRVVL